MSLGYIANIIFNAFQKEGHANAYLAEKRDQLADLDKFQSLLFSNSCGEGIQQSVAKEIGVTLDDLKITINVLSHC